MGSGRRGGSALITVLFVWMFVRRNAQRSGCGL